MTFRKLSLDTVMIGKCADTQNRSLVSGDQISMQYWPEPCAVIESTCTTAQKFTYLIYESSLTEKDLAQPRDPVLRRYCENGLPSDIVSDHDKLLASPARRLNDP